MGKIQAVPWFLENGCHQHICNGTGVAEVMNFAEVLLAEIIPQVVELILHFQMIMMFCGLTCTCGAEITKWAECGNVLEWGRAH